MQYQILTDTHTHTLSSAHAYSTLTENIRAAGAKGLELIAVTEHGPDLVDAPHEYGITNNQILPRKIDGIWVLRGVEANVIDYRGGLDIDPKTLAGLDLVIASIHSYVLSPGTLEEHDRIWRAVASNPLVDVIGHSGQEQYHYHYEEIIPVFGQYNKIVEINSHSPSCRKGAYENCREIALLCKKYGVPITVSSDAHSCFEIGEHTVAKEILNQVDFPEELIVNRSARTLMEFLSKKKGISFGE